MRKVVFHKWCEFQDKMRKVVFHKRCDFQSGDRWTLGLALAHNVVLHWDWHTGDILQRVTCTEKCILYPFADLLCAAPPKNNICWQGVGGWHSRPWTFLFPPSLFFSPPSVHAPIVFHILRLCVCWKVNTSVKCTV